MVIDSGKRLRTTAIVLGVSGSLVVSACGGGASSRSGAGSGGKVVKAASASAACKRAEGKLNYNAASESGDFAKEFAVFHKKYPKIRINYSSSRPGDAVQRLLAQTRAGKAPDIDVIAGDIPSVYPLMQSGQAADVDWASVGVPKNLIVDVNGVHVWREYRMLLGLGYMTSKFKDSQLPSTWQQLVNPKWGPGKVVVDPRGAYLSGLALAWGKQKTVAWMNQMMKVDKPTVLEGATDSLQKVISGEAQVTTSSHNAEIVEQKGHGAPVGIKYLDVVPAQDYYETMVKGAPHPNAALCFMSWWASPEGQATQMKVEFRNAKTPKLPAGSKLASITTPKQAKLAADTASALSKVITGGG